MDLQSLIYIVLDDSFMKMCLFASYSLCFPLSLYVYESAHMEGLLKCTFLVPTQISFLSEVFLNQQNHK